MSLCTLLFSWLDLCVHGELCWENSAYGKEGRAEWLCGRWDCPSSLSPLNAGSSNSLSATRSLLRSLAVEAETRSSCRSLEGDGRGEGGDGAVRGHKVRVSDTVTASLAPLQILFEYHIYNHTTMYVLYIVTYRVFTGVLYICTITRTQNHRITEW